MAFFILFLRLFQAVYLFNFISGHPRDELIPSENGHIVGWVPIDPSLRNHLWHLSVVDLVSGYALVANYVSSDGSLRISFCPLEKMIGSTVELIGTNVNANPYGKLLLQPLPTLRFELFC